MDSIDIDIDLFSLVAYLDVCFARTLYGAGLPCLRQVDSIAVNLLHMGADIRRLDKDRFRERMLRRDKQAHNENDEMNSHGDHPTQQSFFRNITQSKLSEALPDAL